MYFKFVFDDHENQSIKVLNKKHTHKSIPSSLISNDHYENQFL